MKYWIGVVSKEHVTIGVDGGFCQVCHGKSAPLNRMNKGDFLLYYSPKISLGSDIKYQAITAIGNIIDDKAYSYQMSENFIPFRRDIAYLPIKQECSLSILKLHSDWKNYNSQLRFGHFEISESLFNYIYDYMIHGIQTDTSNNFELF